MGDCVLIGGGLSPPKVTLANRERRSLTPFRSGGGDNSPGDDTGSAV